MNVIKGVILLLSSILVTSCFNQQERTQEQEYSWDVPTGFPKPFVPERNPMTQAKIELGRHIFYDKALSSNQSQSCSSCHIQKHAFAEPLKVSIGSTGEAHHRNSPALVNIAYNKTLTWAHDGLTELERQLLLPIFGERPLELGATGNESKILHRFGRAPYPILFKKAFGDSEPDFNKIVQALSSFTRSLISLNTPFDEYAYQGIDDAISEDALAGMNLFFSEKLECHHCHGGFNFTQSTSHEKQPLDRRPFHNTGLYFTERKKLTLTKLDQGEVSMGYPEKDIGLAGITGNFLDDGRFRAPTLRNIELTAPYMHDGSVTTLEEVIDIYAAGGRNVTQGLHQGDGRKNPLKSQFVKGFEITNKEKQQLITFLKTLTDETFITMPAHSDPWKVQRQYRTVESKD
ncbi:di-heme enzyme [Shewanella sp. 202IG2-18]|uniref:MbnH family di-heme enzyme n=1 Tax=Parashewanella hymeniacidonis TaxID=2807618 RepID=UPI001961EB22|nr:MbnH family di-heme enzyme [Parashewanella hymeniacidonis]MBM7071029.1 di-heme enzyme [Parashewanella hymeniacidonis]